MTDHRPRSSYESDNLPPSKATARSAMCITIGQGLIARYEVPQNMPHGILALLMQLNEPPKKNDCRLSWCGKNFKPKGANLEGTT